MRSLSLLVILATCVAGISPAAAEGLTSGKRRTLAEIETLGWRAYYLAPGISLDGSYSKVRDADMATLKAQTQLKILSVCHTGVGDAGLKNLNGLRGIVSLDLTSTATTDAGLAYLKDMTAMKTLRLGDTRSYRRRYEVHRGDDAIGGAEPQWRSRR